MKPSTKANLKAIGVILLGFSLCVGLFYATDHMPENVVRVIAGVISVSVVLAILWFSGIIPAFIRWIKSKWE